MTVKVNHSTPADGTFSAQGALAWDADHTLTGVGTMAEQNANNVNITGGSITGITIGSATNIAGGTANQLLYQTGAGATNFITAPTVSGTYLNWSGSAFQWSANPLGDVVGPASATDNAIARFDLTTGKLIQNSVVTVSDTGVVDGISHINDVDYIDFDTTYATTLGAGQLGWNGNDTLGLGMIGGNVIQHIGEDSFFYVKASATITKGQLCMFTGAVGSSGVLTAAPATAIPFAEAIIGVAAENIANNGFGLVQNTGTLRGVNTSAFLDGDILYYNSAVTGGFTKTFPANGPIVIAAAVAKAGSGGSGILTVRISFQTRVTAGTGISVTQGNDVVTVTNTAPSLGGTVTSVSGTGTVSGISLSGTVTSTGSLTLGGSLDLSSPPAIGGSVPNAITGTTITASQYVNVGGGNF